MCVDVVCVDVCVDVCVLMCVCVDALWTGDCLPPQTQRRMFSVDACVLMCVLLCVCRDGKLVLSEADEIRYMCMYVFSPFPWLYVGSLPFSHFFTLF